MANRIVSFSVTALKRLTSWPVCRAALIVPVLLVAAASGATQARAQGTELVDATDPERLARIIMSNGFQATVARDSRGDPMIRSAAEGVNFVILFYGCQQNANCRSIQYSVSFRMGKPPTLQALNSFNLSRTLGEASLSSAGLPRLTYFMTLQGGVSEANFLHAFSLWRDVLSAFVRYIGFRP